MASEPLPLGNTEESIPDLAIDIAYLQRLDHLRKRAYDLRDQGIRAILQSKSSAGVTPITPFWQKAETSIDRVLLRRVKHLAADNDLLEEHHKFEGYPDVQLSDVGGAQADCEYLFCSQDREGTVPVFLAAEFMRSQLDELPLDPVLKSSDLVPATAFIPESIFLCVYRIVREVYSIDSPRWTFGGAQAGNADGAPSVFITSECSRALGHFASMLESTARMVDRCRETLEYSVQIQGNAGQGLLQLPEHWCATESRRVARGFRLTIEELSGSTLLRLDILLGLIGEESGSESEPASEPRRFGEPKGLSTAVAQLLCRLFIRSAKSVNDALSQITDLRIAEKYESEREVRKELRANGPPPEIRQGGTHFDLSATGHAHALRFLEHSRDLLEYISVECRLILDSCATDEHCVQALQLLPKLASFCRKSAREVRRLMGPIAQYMANELDQFLVNSTHGKGVADTQEIVFAAATLGSISRDWTHQRFRLAVDQILSLLSNEGMLPPGRPFHLDTLGSERIPINAHALRALAQLLDHIPTQLDETVVARMLRYFDFTAYQTGQDSEIAIAWRRSGAGVHSDFSPWVSAVSVATLNRIARMLDRRINTRLLRHFDSKNVRSLQSGLLINDLMCTDIGLSLLQWPRNRSRHPITWELERIRQHLHGRKSGVDDGPLHSLILYGPPGTGKTTIVEALAATAEAPLLVITPSDLVKHGAEGVEERAIAIMEALPLLRRAVILFDEFDTVIQQRSSQKPAKSVFQFLTGNMLPKLARLAKAAKEGRFAYILATNFVERLDSAAIRPGRFAFKRGVYPADAVSRTCRLVAQWNRWDKPPGFDTKADDERNRHAQAARLLEVVVKTAGAPVVKLCEPGWFTAPKPRVMPARGTPFRYILDGAGSKDEPQWPMAADVSRAFGPRSKPSKGQPEPPARFDNTLEIDQAAEMSLVCHWDRQIQDALDDYTGADDVLWQQHIQDCSHTPEAILEDWDAWYQFLRRSRQDASRFRSPPSKNEP